MLGDFLAKWAGGGLDKGGCADQQTSEFSKNSEVLGFWRGHHSGQAGGGDGSGGDDGLYGATPPSSALRRPYIAARGGFSLHP